jgi:hypothetical protein
MAQAGVVEREVRVVLLVWCHEHELIRSVSGGLGSGIAGWVQYPVVDVHVDVPQSEWRAVRSGRS